jgi:hypothetical protein
MSQEQKRRPGNPATDTDTEQETTEVVVPPVTKTLDDLSQAIEREKQKKAKRQREYCCGCCE